MTLLGIRAVVRRGINITCTHEVLDSKLWSRLPFNIKELYPLGIGPDTANQNRRVGKILLDALAKRQAYPEYLDLPGFNALRRTTFSDRYKQRILWDDDEEVAGILWLCSFHSDYTDENDAWTMRNKVQAAFGEEVELLRVTELLSPELVSQKLFVAIRRYELCLIDWTQWSSNLFFEFGIRLAASPIAPVCYISNHPRPPWEPKESNMRLEARFAKHQEQVEWLTDAFTAIPYRVGSDWNAVEAKLRVEATRKAINTPGALVIAPTYGLFRFDRIYSVIASEIHGEEELHKSPAMVLREAAERLVRKSAGITTVPAIYADKNFQLQDSARRCAVEYFVAAWRYAVGELTAAENPSDDVKVEVEYLANQIESMLKVFDNNDNRKQTILKELHGKDGTP